MINQITINNQKITLDATQKTLREKLENLRQKIESRTDKPNFWSKIFGKKQQNKLNNFYIYGEVGRGKSMLMGYFFKNLAIKNDQKTYVHFNEFMQQIHRHLHELRKEKRQKEQLVFLALKKILPKTRLICFDEMQVEDVADAMILRDVFSYFAQNNITVLTTSNCHPLDLYENGLQRESFLQFIREEILANYQIYNLDNQIDYRTQFIGSKNHYFFPNNSANKKAILEIWRRACENSLPTAKTLTILGRELIVKKSYKNIALFDFAELCQDNLGVVDYQAICAEFSVIFLLNLPILKPEDRGAAKRFIWFIDEIYESKASLLILAEDAPEKIYKKGVGAKAFKRTISRLQEIL